MKVRQDAWTDENDLLLAETVLRHVREGSTQLNAFEEVGDKLNRTSAACGFRWNAVVRHRYEKALQLAKKQRKQRQRMLGKEQGGKKKLLYSPPVPSLDEISYVSQPIENDMGLVHEMEVAMEAPPTPVLSTTSVATGGGMNLDTVISYLQNLGSSNFQVDILKSENERLKRENTDIRRSNQELEKKIEQLEQNAVTIQEDYETLMKIMNRARKLVLFEEEERPASTFKMDRNGNLEKVAE
ncbi:RsfA family transcriptional regulator [Robertmurraya yapensis]|uniref:RsfA family transcriptional regulator n=1 Tax=Bacillus yapensis TaxID=2492960 RepID=A0A3S0IG24_9BACI|nr:RsfA family transcriptional regulator [Bacillus yapensis]RTR33044.1 RsfA family transcriptional regulator [Bacillus yapensis]TKS96867.1 RsfA family transcriptional regulator [Bacillus yapensis]